MATYTNPDGRVFTIPTYSDFSDGPQNFKDFAATMPSYGNDVYDVSGTVQFTAHHTSRIVKFTAAGEYVVDDTAPTGTQVTVATWNAFVSVMTSGVQVEPAAERLIPPYSMVILTKVGAGMWLVAKGSGGAGNYFNEATGGTVTEIADYNGTGELWRVHTFTGNGTLDVSTAINPFRVLVVGGAGGGGARSGEGSIYAGGGGGGGGVLENSSTTFAAGLFPVAVGAGRSGQFVTGFPSSVNGLQAGGGANGQGWSNGQNGGASGTPSVHGGGSNAFVFNGGGGGGAGSSGSASDANRGGWGGGGITSNITGTNAQYGQGGQGGDGNSGYAGRAGFGAPGSQNGIVVISYQIG